MKRICPNCNHNLNENEYYFCLSCGHKLEDELIVNAGIFAPKITKFVSEPDGKKKRHKLSKKKKKDKIKVRMPGLRKQLIIGFSSVVLIGGSAVGIIFLTNNLPKVRKEEEQAVTQQPQTQQEVKELNVIDLSLDQPNINLANENIIKYIPYETDFYIIGSDIVDSAERIYGQLASDAILSSVEEYVEGRFVVMGNREGSEWVLTTIIYLKDSQVVDLTFENVSAEGWFVQKVDDVLVVTNKEEMIQNVTDSSKGLARNVAQNPKTRTDNIDVPKSGQLIFVNVDKETNILKELVDLFNLEPQTREQLEDIINNKPTKFVIKNENE